MQIIKSTPAGLNGICYGILAGLQTLWKDAEARSRLHFHEHFLEPPHGTSLTSRLPLPPASEPHRLCRDPWSCHTCDSSPYTSAITCASTEGVLGLALFSHSSWPNQISHVSDRACSHGYTFCSQGRIHNMGNCQRQPFLFGKKQERTRFWMPTHVLLNNPLFCLQREFHGSPVVRTQHFHCWDPGSIPGRGTKILQAMWPGQNKQIKICSHCNVSLPTLPWQNCRTVAESLFIVCSSLGGFKWDTESIK